MSAVVNALVLYSFLIVLFRCAGKRTLHQATVFDLVLVLVIAEAAQGVLVGEDPSMLQALVVIATLVLQIRFAVLERDGRISIVPRRDLAAAGAA